MLAGAGATCLLVALVGPALTRAEAQDTASRPDVFRSAASALVVESSLDREALIPVPDAFRFMAVEGRGTYESSNQTAQSSLLYPGNGVISGPNLACGTFGRQFPPEFKPILDACTGFQFPLSVRADSLKPDASSTGATQVGSPGDPLSGEVVRAVAHAAADSSTTDAAMSALRLLGLPGVGSLDTLLPSEDVPNLDNTVLTIDGATSRTNQRIDETGALVVDASSTLSGVRLIGGLVEIGTIRSVASITDDGRGTQTRDTDLEIGGVTVGGIPARITGDGLEIGSPTGGLGPLADQLRQVVNRLVSALGIKITMLDVADGVDDNGSAFARVGGVLIEYEFALENLPTVPGPLGDIDLNGLYRGSMALGHAAALGQASYIDVPEFVPAPLPDAGGVPPVTTPGGSFTPDGSAPSPPIANPPSTSNEETAAPNPGQEELIRVTSFEQLVEGRLRLVYIAFALLALAACIAPRFAFPARLPGASS